MPKVSLRKAAAGRQAAVKAPRGAGIVDFIIQDDGATTFTVLGVDKAGAELDISAIATLSGCVSDNPAALTVDPPVGMASAMHGVMPGVANVTVTATWNDGSIGPFTFTLPVTVTTGGVTGLTISIGTPIVA